MPKSETIGKNFIKAYNFINKDIYDSIMVSILGGADSDIVLDICCKCDINNKCRYVWFDES
jgi:hypothetical protein